MPIGEMRRVLLKHKGPMHTGLPIGRPPSTTICWRDIAVLAKIELWLICLIGRGEEEFNFCAPHHPKWKQRLCFGGVRRRRLTTILRLVEGGYVTKRKSEDCTIHDTPQVKPAPPPMKITLGADGPKLQSIPQGPQVAKMPGFSAVFGSGFTTVVKRR